MNARQRRKTLKRWVERWVDDPAWKRDRTRNSDTRGATFCERYSRDWDGSSYSAYVIHRDGRGFEEVHDGRDCDGRISSARSFTWNGQVDGERRPFLRKVDESRRDYQAEAAGY